MDEFKLISKTIFFPEQGILAVGDLHLGYESMLKKQGINLPFNQLERAKKEIQDIISKINGLRKIILLGDIKHYFGFDKSEFFEIRDFIEFLEQFAEVILIKGNHDVVESKRNYFDYYVEGDLAFTHGHRIFSEVFDKKIKTIVVAHIHPAVLLKDKAGIKKEKYKVFLIGKYKRKNFLVVPSFFPLIEGSEINEIESSGTWKQIIPNQKLSSFDVYVVSPQEEKVYEFGKLGDLV